MQSLTPVGLIITEARRKRERAFTVASRKLTPDPSQIEAIVFTIFAAGRGAGRARAGKPSVERAPPRRRQPGANGLDPPAALVIEAVRRGDKAANGRFRIGLVAMEEETDRAPADERMGIDRHPLDERRPVGDGKNRDEGLDLLVELERIGPALRQRGPQKRLIDVCRGAFESSQVQRPAQRRARGLADFDLSAREQSSERHQHGWMDGVARRRLVDHRADILERFARRDVASRSIEPRLVQRLVEFGQHLGGPGCRRGHPDQPIACRRSCPPSRRRAAILRPGAVEGRSCRRRERKRPSLSRFVSGAPASAACWRASSWGSLSSGESEAPSLIRRLTGANCGGTPVHKLRKAKARACEPPHAKAILASLSLGASAREAVRRRSRAKIAEAYSLERMTRDTLSIYAEALAR